MRRSKQSSPVVGHKSFETKQSGSFVGNMMSGFSLGLGQSMAFQAVNGVFNTVFGSNKVTPEISPNEKYIHELYEKCLKDTGYDFQKCDYIKKKDPPESAGGSPGFAFNIY